MYENGRSCFLSGEATNNELSKQEEARTPHTASAASLWSPENLSRRLQKPESEFKYQECINS
jgi:hypothetical protein